MGRILIFRDILDILLHINISRKARVCAEQMYLKKKVNFVPKATRYARSTLYPLRLEPALGGEFLFGMCGVCRLLPNSVNTALPSFCPSILKGKYIFKGMSCNYSKGYSWYSFPFISQKTSKNQLKSHPFILSKSHVAQICHSSSPLRNPNPTSKINPIYNTSIAFHSYCSNCNVSIQTRRRHLLRLPVPLRRQPITSSPALRRLEKEAHPRPRSSTDRQLGTTARQLK